MTPESLPCPPLGHDISMSFARAPGSSAPIRIDGGGGYTLRSAGERPGGAAVAGETSNAKPGGSAPADHHRRLGTDYRRARLLSRPAQPADSAQATTTSNT